MTPIIIKTTDGETTTIPLSEFNKMIERITEEAYNEGFAAGQNSHYVWYPPVYNPPIIHWDDFVYRPEITCDTNSNITINSTGEVTQNDNA